MDKTDEDDVLAPTPPPPRTGPVGSSNGMDLFMRELTKLDNMVDAGVISSHEYTKRLEEATKLLYE